MKKNGICLTFIAVFVILTYMSCSGEEKKIPEKLIQVEYLNIEEQRELLKLARLTAESYLKTYKRPDVSYTNDRLTKNCGAFVTLNKNHRLRGCIGYILPLKPLYQTIIENTVNALVNDPRFKPVTFDELNDIVIEISVLTPPVEIKSYKKIELGKHGIILKKAGRQAVFLPQVPVEQHWDLEMTLNQLNMKAELAPAAWKDANFSVFSAQVFSEE